MAKATTSNLNTNENSKSVRPITLESENGEVYVLEFNRASIKYAEAQGFDVQSLEKGVNMSGIEDLFHYSFRMHQPRMQKNQTDKILYEDLGGLRDGMLERLVELYLLPFNTLVASDGSEKNSKMTVRL